MEQIIITHRNGTTLKLNSKENVSAITKATQSVELLGSDIVDISVQSANKLNFYLGDKITVIGRDYTLNTPAKERKTSDNNFAYDIQFEGVQYDLLRASFNVNIDTTSNEIQDISGDSITGNIKMFLDVLVSNANRVFGTGKWLIGSYPLNSKTITLTFSDTDNCLTVLQNLCNESNFGTEFKINIDGNGIRTINIGEIGNTFAHTFQYGKGKGIYELTREKSSSSNIITRLYAFGGSKNIITPKYRASNLCLPAKSKSQSFIESSAGIANFGVWEATKEFPEVYPHRKGVISSLGANVFEFIDSSMNFDLNEKNTDGTTKFLMGGTSAKISFNTGNLAGYEFEVSKYDSASKKFTIISQTDQNDYIFPSTTSVAFQLKVGDEYIITDIYMPQSYIDTAESLLTVKANEYLSRFSQPLVQYSLVIDSFFLKNQVGAGSQSNLIWVGDYIPIKDTDLEVDKTIRVKGFTRDLMQDYAYQLTIADLSVTVSIINRAIATMEGIDKVVKINDLNNPAKARRNWKDSQEVLNMVFDPEGDFYTDKIKPLSIETSMLSVGAKSMQFGLEGTFFQPNLGGNPNRINYIGGSLVHYSVLDANDNPRVWNISTGDMLVLDNSARYVYARCSRSGSGAIILFLTDKIKVESDPNYYHFLIGILNSVDVNNTRAFALMYGFTTVNGRFIKTGRIQSSTGTNYFDLDTGEFRGNFTFISGNSVESSVNTAQSTANTAVTNASNAQSTANTANANAIAAEAAAKAYADAQDVLKETTVKAYADGIVTAEEARAIADAQTKANTAESNAKAYALAQDNAMVISGRNLLTNSKSFLSTYYADYDNYAYYYESKVFLKAYTNYIFRGKVSSNLQWSGSHGVPYGENRATVWLVGADGFHQIISDIVSGTTGTVFSVGIEQTYSIRTNTYKAGTFEFYDLKIEEATKATDWSPAPEDVEAEIASKSKHFTGTTPPIPPYTQGRDTWTNGTELYDCAITRASGGYVSGDFVKATGYDNTKTTIDGGLVTGGTLQVAGDSNIKAGITGQGTADSSIRMWSGTTFANRDNAPFRVQQGGKVFMTDAEIQGVIKALSGSIGNFTIKDGNIIGSDGGVERVKLKTGLIETVGSMDSAAWQELPFNLKLDDTYIGGVHDYRPIGGGFNPTAKLVRTNTIVAQSNTTLRFFGNGITERYDPYEEVYTTSKSETFELVGVDSNIIPTPSGTSVLINAGTYTLNYIVSVTADLTDSQGHAVFATNSGVKVEIQQGIGKTEIGKNGFFSYFGSNNYVHYSQENGLVFKGNLNVPGFLASGTIASNGAKALLCGSKNNSAPATYTATGIYDVPHNAGANYQVMLSPLGDNIRAYLVYKSNDTFRVQLRNGSGATVAGVFDYTILGVN